MKSIRLYNTTADYTADIENLPSVNVVKTKDDGKIHYMGMKEVQNHFITETEYGTAVFDCFRSAGWIDQDATYMTKAQAASITDIGTTFKNNTSIEDVTFMRYFTGLTELTSFKNFNWQGFHGCTSLKRACIPHNITGDYDIFHDCGATLEYVEVLEGVTSVGNRFLGSTCNAAGCEVVFPSTLESLASRSIGRIKSQNGILDLSHTSISTIGNTVMYRSYNIEKVLFPNTLLSIGTECFSNIIYGLKYVEFNSNTSLSIGNNCFGNNNQASYENITFNFKNNIPITIGDNFANQVSKKCIVIFNSTTPPTIGTSFFNKSSSSTEIYVPDGCVSDYEAVANLSSFVGRIYEIGGTEWTAAGLSQYE